MSRAATDNVVDKTRRGRKFTLAVWAMALVSVFVVAIVVISFVNKELPDGGLVMATLGGIATVLGSYGAANAGAAFASRPQLPKP